MRLTLTTFRRFIGIGKESNKYANLPESYIERTMRRVYYKTPRKIQYLPRTVERKKFYFSVHRPWTYAFREENEGPAKHIFVEPIKDWSFFRGDLVEILVGRDKGKQGYVSEIIQERNWVIVKGLNTKLILRGKTKESGMLVPVEQPLLVTTDILLVDPHELKGTKIEWHYNEKGEKVRVSCLTGRIIPIPASDVETIDYISPQAYKENEKDTTRKDVEEVTFKPELKTFAMDIMDKMGIVEDRVPKKYFWY